MGSTKSKLKKTSSRNIFTAAGNGQMFIPANNGQMFVPASSGGAFAPANNQHMFNPTSSGGGAFAPANNQYMFSPASSGGGAFAPTNSGPNMVIQAPPPELPANCLLYMEPDKYITTVTVNLTNGMILPYNTEAFGDRSIFIILMSRMNRTPTTFSATVGITKIEFIVSYIGWSVEIRFLTHPTMTIVKGSQIFSTDNNGLGQNIVDIIGGELIPRPHIRSYYDNTFCMIAPMFFQGEFRWSLLYITAYANGRRYYYQMCERDAVYQFSKISEWPSQISDH